MTESSSKGAIRLALSLRCSVRLVHCLQKERGASCLYCAFTSTITETSASDQADLIGAALFSARRDTDAAILLATKRSLEESEEGAIWVRYSVERIRELVDVEGCDGAKAIKPPGERTPIEEISSAEKGFHRMLVGFNCAISDVIRVLIVKQVRSSPYYRSAAGPMEGQNHRRTRTISHSSLFDDMKRWGVDIAASPTNSTSNSPQKSRDKDSGGSNDCAHDRDLRSPLAESDSSNNTSATMDNKAEEKFLSSLLSILLLFVRLKESTGIERAILSSLVAQDSSNVSQFYVMPFVNDLVMEIENQHNIIRKLQKLAKYSHGATANAEEEESYNSKMSFHHHSTAGLLSLVKQSVVLSPFMKRLQDMIRENFDLVGFRQATTLEGFWDDITLYIDKLHSLELLIIEELECCTLILDNEAKTAPVETMVDGTKETMSSWAAPVNSKDQDICAITSADGEEQQHIAITTEGNSNKVGLNEKLQLLHELVKPNVMNTSTAPDDAFSKDNLACMINQMSPEEIKSSLVSFVTSATATTFDQKEENIDKPGVEEAVTREEDCITTATSTLQNVNMPSASLYSKTIIKAPSSALNAATPSTASIDCVDSKEWEIGLYEVEFQKRIGRGTAGTTYLAKWCGQDVAVKVAAVTEMGVGGWNAEVKTLSKLHHPNIIRLLGSIYNESPLTYCLVLEYCDSGDLSKALLRFTPRNFFSRVAINIANGMTYLHSRKILHRDIKPGNVLLQGDVQGGNFTAKLTDFGVSTGMQGLAREEHTAETGTYRWMAPEVIRHESYSYKADVWSFAVVVWQLITREEPFCQYSQIEAAGMVALEQARLPFPKDIPNGVRLLIERCWRENPDDRLAFDAIGIALAKIEQTLDANEQLWLQEPYGHPVYNLKKESLHSKKIGRSKSWEPISDPATKANPLQLPRSERKSFMKMFSRSKHGSK